MLVVAPAKKRPGNLQVYDAQSQTLLYTIAAFKGTACVEVATGDVNGDDVLDIIAAQIGVVRVFDGATGKQFTPAIGQFRPFGKKYKGPVFVASGDLNNAGVSDGIDDIIVGRGTGKALVRAWDSVDFNLTNTRIANINAFPGSTKGVRVAAGQSGLGGPGEEIYAAAGPGIAFEVKIFDTASNTPLNGTAITPYGTAFKKSGFIAVGDVNSDGIADILTGPGGLVGQPVHTVDGATLGVNAALSFVPFAGFGGPIRVALADVNGDGRLDAITARGNNNREVTLWDLQAPTGPATQLVMDTIFAFDPAFNFGLNLAGGTRI
jgi:hypothetical protein